MTEFIITCQSELLKDGSYKIERYRELVRCKDCKHGCKPSTFQYYPEVTWCNKHSTSHSDDWFCADGKRRTE